MATVYVIRHRGMDGTYTEGLRKEREARLLEGLSKTGRVIDRHGESHRGELRGIQNRIDRIRSGKEKVK
jgi:hypothetical protein